MAHPADDEAESAERLLAAFDGAQLLFGHFRVIGDPRREAGRGRFVPGREAGAAGQFADFVLSQIRLVERAADAELAGGLAARPVVAAVVGIVAVDHD
jgi:hypothetical protein